MSFVRSSSIQSERKSTFLSDLAASYSTELWSSAKRANTGRSATPASAARRRISPR
jgi:hypothetical protein